MSISMSSAAYGAFVAGGLTLLAVEVDRKQGHLPSRRRRGERLLQPLVQQTPVRQSGERIVRRQVGGARLSLPAFFLALALLGDVAHQAHQPRRHGLSVVNRTAGGSDPVGAPVPPDGAVLDLELVTRRQALIQHRPIAIPVLGMDRGEQHLVVRHQLLAGGPAEAGGADVGGGQSSCAQIEIPGAEPSDPEGEAEPLFAFTERDQPELGLVDVFERPVPAGDVPGGVAPRDGAGAEPAIPAIRHAQPVLVVEVFAGLQADRPHRKGRGDIVRMNRPRPAVAQRLADRVADQRAPSLVGFIHRTGARCRPEDLRIELDGMAIMVFPVPELAGRRRPEAPRDLVENVLGSRTTGRSKNRVIERPGRLGRAGVGQGRRVACQFRTVNGKRRGNL